MVRFTFLMLTFLFMSAAEAGKCPAGFGHWFRSAFHSSRPSCYKFVKTDLSWVQARKHCLGMGADLVTIETSGENSHLVSIIRRNSSLQYPEIAGYRYFGYWTGGNDLEREGDWRWVSGNTRLTYTNWWWRQPNNYYGGTEHCLQLMKNYDWKWNDARCYVEIQASICEIDARYT